MLDIEKNILEKAIQVFHQNTGLTLLLYKEEAGNNLIDCTLKFINHKGKESLLATEIKGNISKITANYVINQFELYRYKSKSNIPNLLISNYISESIAKELIANNIFFIDCVGNSYLKIDSVFVSSFGYKKKLEKSYIKPKAFQSAGIKLLFALFINENLLNQTYREIADFTGIATGSLSEIFRNLKENNFLVTLKNGEKVLVNRKRLLEKFIIGYQEYLKPKLQSKKYKLLNNNLLRTWQELNFENKSIFWGAEPAAALQTNYLQPEQLSIYTAVDRKELLQLFRAAPDEKGNLEIQNLFWTIALQDLFPQKNCVPPLLAYIELVLSEDSRNLEAAKMIYEKYLSNFFERN
jgi:hypothetical protein